MNRKLMNDKMGTPSKDKMKNELNHCLDSSLNKLQKIWSDIGICESQRQERSNTVMLHLRNLLDEMVQEEDTLKNQILMRIEKYTKEVAQLCDELGVAEFKVKGGSMLQREKELRAKLDALTKEKHERLRVLKKYKDEDQLLCDAMCLTPYYIPTGATPTAEQLKALETHITTLKAEKDKRFKDFVSTKKAVIDLFNQMDRNPDSEFEREVFCEEDDSFLLSLENIRSLKTLHSELEDEKDETTRKVKELWDRLTVLWDRLCVPEEERSDFREGKDGIKPPVIKALKEEISECERKKFENIQKFVEGMRKELVTWWDKCFFSKRRRDEFLPFQDENYTEELLEEHDKEVSRLKHYYEEHKQLFEDISRWEVLFRQMIEFERKASDPNRYYNNRGGMLLQEEKARKRVLKELPKLEEEVKESIVSWEKENGRDFLIDGVRFLQYIEQQWKVHQESKIKEKEQRHKQRARQTEEEMIFGSKPSTPVKRRFLTTPTKTPISKIRKLNDTTKTPSSCSRLQQSNAFASPYARAPMSSSRLVPSSKSAKRRSLRLARKVLSEKNTGGHTNETLFSHTTVSSCGQPNVVNVGEISVASTGTYQDFANGINSTSRQYCRSSLMPGHSPGKKV